MGLPIIDMTGFKSNRWTVVSKTEKPLGAKQSGVFWNCVCECGKKAIVYGQTIRKEKSKSCGCLKSEQQSLRMKEMRLQQSGCLQDRFFARFVKLENGCWQWRAHTDLNGYGYLPGDLKHTRAHRFSYEFHIGKIPEAMLICHKCDNPGCVNPDHLFVGTSKDNAQDALQKGRAYVGEKNGMSKLTKENIKEILSSELNGVQLAQKFEVTRSTINRVRRREAWL